MIYFIYDGSFEGLLTAIYQAYYSQEKPEHIVTLDHFEENLFSQIVEICTDLEKADRVYRAIEQKISPQTLKHVYYAFLSETKDVGTLIYRYLQMGWQVGQDINQYISHDRVREVLSLSQRVNLERHRMLGLIRFQRLTGDLYYAAMEPDNNIVALMAPHFVKRFADQNWIIHDINRGLAVLYNQREWIITNIESYGKLVFEEKETFYQHLWQDYFSSVAIKDRANPKLQRQYMPVRYWRNLIEKR